MKILKKLSMLVLSGTLALSAFSAMPAAAAAETAESDVSLSDSVSTGSDAVNAVSETPDESTTVTATDNEVAVADNSEVAAAAETSEETTAAAEEDFDVFAIYEAHMKYVASTTTTTMTTTTTTTTTTKTTTTTVTSRNLSSGLKGIDVSKWQGTINWSAVKADGINFAIIRAGYGMLLPSQEDPYFDTNMTNAKKVGMDVGVYWYSYAKTAEEAALEAELCYSVIKGYSFEYPLFFDIEDPSQANLSAATISAIVDTFCSKMESYGYYVSVYSYANWLSTKIYSSVLQKYDTWVAQWSSSCTYSGGYGIWQYSSTGSVNGISGNVDMDYSYVDYPYIIKTKHKNGY